MNLIEIIMLGLHGAFDIIFNIPFMGTSLGAFLIGLGILRVIIDFVRSLYHKSVSVNRDEIKQYNKERDKIWKDIFKRVR